MTSTTSFFNFPYGFFQQQQLSHSKSDEFLEDDSPASLSRSPSSSSIDYPLDSESSSSSLRISHKLDSVVAPPPLMAHPFASTHIPSDTTSNTGSPTGSPVHPSAVQVKRKRGRPPKPKTPSEDGHESSSSQDGATSVAPASPPKRKRGRPPGKKKKSEQEFVYYLDESTGSVTPTASRQEQDDKDYSDDGSPKNVPSTFPTAFGLQMQLQMSPQQPIKRGRGRPRKYPAPTPQNVQSKPLPLSTSLDWMDSFDQDLTPFTFEPPSDYAIVDYLRSIVNEQSKSLLGYTEVRGLLECHFGMDLQYRQYYIEESLDLLCPYS